MTGFARAEGTTNTLNWRWELRSVNGRGFDLRLRLPPGCDSLETGLREISAQALRRGNVTANLSVQRQEANRLTIDRAMLDLLLDTAMDLAARIPGAPAPRAEHLLGLPGVLRNTAPEETEAEAAATLALLRAGFDQALASLVEARNGEGGRLAAILRTLLGEIAELHAQAKAEAARQPEAQRARMREAVNALLGETPRLPEERIAQEIALLASKSDVREELDRLQSHIEAAQALLAEGRSIGRRFDFLVQEFNREANTLCSKSASAALTGIGLRLKAVIEQLREQVQNIE